MTEGYRYQNPTARTVQRYLSEQQVASRDATIADLSLELERLRALLVAHGLDPDASA